MSEVIINDFTEQWRERREKFEIQGYEIFAELPKNWSVKQAESFVRHGFAVPVQHGRAYLAIENGGENK